MRYYFHIRRGQVTVLDNQGLELSDTYEATRQGLAMAASESLKGVPPNGGSIIVDDGSEIIIELPFADIAH
jgi:hypothetical protein